MQHSSHSIDCGQSLTHPPLPLSPLCISMCTCICYLHQWWATPSGLLPWDSHQTMTSVFVWDTGRPNGDQHHPLVPVDILLLRLLLQYVMGKLDLCMREFDQFLMRKHLLLCFQNGAVLPFPPQSIAARKPKVLKEEVVEIHCHCRLPYTGRKIVQCDGCQKWFHCDCLRAVSPGLIRRSTNWYRSPVCSKTASGACVNSQSCHNLRSQNMHVLCARQNFLGVTEYP